MEADALLGSAAAAKKSDSPAPPRSAVSFMTAVLLGCALAFHSLLEVRLTRIPATSPLSPPRPRLAPSAYSALPHRLLQGAALGAQETMERTVDIFIAIVAHKVRRP